MNWRILVAAVLALLLLVVLAQNAASIPVRFLFWRLDASLFAVILLALLAGFVGGFAAAKVPRRKSGA